MTPYILYGDRRSGSSTVEMALAEIGAPVQLHDVPLDGDNQLAEAYRRINPMGRVPTLLLPDGTVMTESLAILLTLDDRHPEAALLPPAGSSDRARALRWMALAAGEFYPHVTRSDYPERFHPDPAQAPAIRARAQEMGRDIWRLVEREANLSPFVLGERFSLADIYLSALTRWMEGDRWIPAHCPRLEALAQAVAVRPKAGPVWRRHFAPAG
ncbi:glutathione S-transferase family protein [Roseomonas haemaphysalidis]|uniref:Glutathione S-transferase family protein n=1 Tax=Roseomonas haemaphysalidis TaxID=2768162 RepID=A0ABS3KR06_9PROT|nr:glutathione S-transferase family protein [Roseomonas haemaphysalidis]MBO1079891.1 glutathione S-transferase family protein [Roseomonas haemaphysalidis]